ncbi:MAG: LOG family protein, partial [Verrucomicrobiota bacterium]|nr:LOG family protein [Verrucomicrobiota bacterium]
EFHYFFIRKFYFLYHAKAVVVFPGGFGTMDELFETLTLIQTKKINKSIPIYLFGKDFWSGLINFNQFVEWGVISPDDLKLFKIVDTVDEAFQAVTKDLSQDENSCEL